MTIEKVLEWAGASKRDLMDFPEDVRRAMGYALGAALFSKEVTRRHSHGKDRH